MATRRKQNWLNPILMAAGVLLALGAGGTDAQAGFQLAIGTDNFYFSVGHHDYYPYYQRSPYRGNGYASRAFSFHNTLNDYGYWQYVPAMGMEVWFPYVDYNWRPYMHGHWVYSPYGWTWVAYEPWGWIPHHYGHWVYLDLQGWAWIPGYTYSPANVSWGVMNGYVGWAPSPPPWYTYRSHRGYRYHGDRGWYHGSHGWHRGSHGGYRDSGWDHDPVYSGIAYSHWVFVDTAHFHGANIAHHAVLSGSSAGFFRDGRVMPLGEAPNVDYVRRVSGTSIPTVALDRQQYQVKGQDVVHYQPRGQEELIRASGLETVNNALAPGYQRHGVSFRGTAAQNADRVNTLFDQQKRAPATRSYKEPSRSAELKQDPYFNRQKKNLDTQAKNRASNQNTAKKDAQPSRTGSRSSVSTKSSGWTPRGDSGSKTRSGTTDRSKKSTSHASSRSSAQNPQRSEDRAQNSATTPKTGGRQSMNRESRIQTGSEGKSGRNSVDQGTRSRKNTTAINGRNERNSRNASSGRTSSSNHGATAGRTSGSEGKTTSKGSMNNSRVKTGQTTRNSGSSATGRTSAGNRKTTAGRTSGGSRQATAGRTSAGNRKTTAGRTSGGSRQATAGRTSDGNRKTTAGQTSGGGSSTIAGGGSGSNDTARNGRSKNGAGKTKSGSKSNTNNAKKKHRH